MKCYLKDENHKQAAIIAITKLYFSKSHGISARCIAYAALYLAADESKYVTS